MMPFIGTTDALDANATFTGATKWSQTFDKVVGSAFADQDGTLHIQQSADGENWDIDTEHSVTADEGQAFSENLSLPFWRILYENGSTDQGSLRISARTIDPY